MVNEEINFPLKCIEFVRLFALCLEFDPTVLVLEDEVVSKLFPRTCASGESWKDEKSTGKTLHCTFQKGDFAVQLNQYIKDAESLGCLVKMI